MKLITLGIELGAMIAIPPNFPNHIQIYSIFVHSNGMRCNLNKTPGHSTSPIELNGKCMECVIGYKSEQPTHGILIPTHRMHDTHSIDVCLWVFMHEVH